MSSTAATIWIAAAAAIALAACAQSPNSSTSTSQDANVITVPTSGTIESISTSPLPLIPAFSESIDDYYVTCGSGSNALAVTVDDAAGESTSMYAVPVNDAVAVGDYWIRCLPPDFPAITVTAHPDVGSATTGYYLVTSVPYAAVLDIHGTPIWYEAAESACDLESFATDTLSYMPNAEYPYAFDPSTMFEVEQLDGSAGSTLVLQSPDAPTNEHELRLLANGDYLIFADQITAHVDLTGLGTFGSDEFIDDCKVEELDPSGALVWSWLGSQHIDAVQESLLQTTNVFDGMTVDDVFHCNAIDVGSAGDLLISSRHASALYDIDKATGTVQWKLGGTAYNKDGAPHIAVVNDPQGGFNLQHDARFLANGDISLFDDHGLDGGSGSGVARGIELAVDHAAGSATIVWQALGEEESQYEGSFRRYADGDSVVGWGYLIGDPRILTEFDAAGSDVLDIAFTLATTFDELSYRAVKVPLTQLDHDVLRATAAQ